MTNQPDASQDTHRRSGSGSRAGAAVHSVSTLQAPRQVDQLPQRNAQRTGQRGVLSLRGDGFRVHVASKGAQLLHSGRRCRREQRAEDVCVLWGLHRPPNREA